jgi:hypothetical protein
MINNQIYKSKFVSIGNDHNKNETNMAKIGQFACKKVQKCLFCHFCIVRYQKFDKIFKNYLINNQIFETRLVSKIPKVTKN